MEATVKLPGAKIVLECIKREGVDIIFGLPGGAVLPIYDALYDFEGLRHILVRQEAAAGHAAEGYARTSGKVGVCLVTSGPAATNLVTALQDAYMDSMPIVAFTGQVPTHLIGNDAFQEADNVGITRPCTKHNFLVKDGKDLGPTIREAFHIASTGRPGPVHVDRSGAAGGGDVERLADRRAEILPVLHEEVVLRARARDPDVVRLLKRVVPDQVRGNLPREGDDRHRVHVGVLQRRHEVRRRGPRRHQAHTDLAARPRVALRGMARRRLLPNEDV